MKRLIMSALLLTSALTPAFAADINMSSKISAVTVFPRGAEILRVASGDILAGENVVIINDLPGAIQASSVRVEGSSTTQMEIGSVDVKQISVSRDHSPQARKKIEDEIEALTDKIDSLQQKIINAKSQRQLIKVLARGAVQPHKGENAGLVITAEQLDSLLDTTANRLAKLTEITQAATIEQRALSRKVAALQKKLGEEGPVQQVRTVVAINFSAADKGTGTFKIKYNVAQAGWSPVYDAKLSVGKQGKNNKLKLVRRASVSQGTPETWDNVALTLSTARPNARTKAPTLNPYILRVRPKYRQAERREKARGYAKLKKRADQITLNQNSLNAPPSPAPIVAEARRPTVRFVGFLAEYQIQGKVNVSNKNAKKTVIIGSNEFKVTLTAYSVPRLDSKAYLTAKFLLTSKTPYLPGQVLLFRDGVFLGKGRMPLLNPKQTHRLSFGSDEFVKITRNKIATKTGESGIFSKSRTEVRNFVTSVKNLHDFEMPITIVDYLPYSSHEDISVTLLADATPATRKDVKKKRGILAWDMTLAAKAEKTIKHGYRVSWPKEKRITPVR